MDKKGIKWKSEKSGCFIFFPFFLLSPQKPEFASHILPFQFLFAISSLIVSLLLMLKNKKTELMASLLQFIV